MKILMATMSFEIGGAETHILELCRQLAQRGHDITVVSNGGVYENELTLAGIKHISLPLHTKRPQSVLKSYFALKKIIENGHYDIVHSHARIPSLICYAIWRKYALRGKNFFHFVTTAHLDFKVNSLTRSLSCWGERCMAVSDDIVDYLKTEYSLYKDRIFTTINGIDCNKFSPEIDCSEIEKKHSLGKKTRKIVYMSRLDDDRAEVAFKLVGISEKINEKYPDTEILIVGGGNLFNKLKSFADEKNRKIGKNYIVLSGPTAQTNLYCAASDIFIGVSRSLLEAMACAKPVIAAGNQGAIGIFDSSKIKPCVDTNFCCRGYENASEDSLFGWIDELLGMDKSQLKKMGEFNRQFILEKYTTSKMADDYMEMYDSVMQLCPYSDKAKKIIISGYYGFGNSGDESLLASIVDSIRKTNKNTYITVLTSNPRKTKREYSVNTINRLNYLSIRKCMKRSYLFINGGGNLFQNKTSMRSLVFYSTLTTMAKKYGCRTMIYGGGLGPIGEGKAEVITKKALLSTDIITLREKKSIELLEKLNISLDGVTVSGDPVLHLSKCEDKWTDRLLDKMNIKKKFFVVSVRNSKGLENNFADSLIQDVNSLKEKYGMECLVVIFQDKEDDKISEYIAQNTNSAIIGNLSYGEVMGIISKSQFVVGMRLHSILYASNVSKPFVSIAYDVKIKAYCDLIGVNWNVDPEYLGSGKVAEVVENIYEDYEGCCEKLERTVALLRQNEKLNIKGVNDCLNEK